MTNANPLTSTAAAIAAQLGEIVSGLHAMMWRVVRTVGPDRAHAFVKEALEAEATGGMLIPDGSRTRTVGGVVVQPICQTTKMW